MYIHVCIIKLEPTDVLAVVFNVDPACSTGSIISVSEPPATQLDLPDLQLDLPDLPDLQLDLPDLPEQGDCCNYCVYIVKYSLNNCLALKMIQYLQKEAQYQKTRKTVLWVSVIEVNSMYMYM